MLAGRPIRVLAWPAGQPDDQNPYVRMMYSAFKNPRASIVPFSPTMAVVPKADIFHVQWPEHVFEGRASRNQWIARAKIWRILRVAKRIRKTGGRVVLTAHNLKPHTPLSDPQMALWSGFHDRLLEHTDLIVSLSSAAADEFDREHPRARVIRKMIVPHPHYREEYPHLSREEGRRLFDLGSASAIGIIGTLRPSKRVVETIGVFRAVARPGEKLLVAGFCDDAYRLEILEAIDDDPAVILYPKGLTSHEMAAAFAAVDVCLINQAHTLNSGTALLALSLDRPVIAPDVGSLPELRDSVGKEWLSLFKPPLDATQLRRALDELDIARPDLQERLASISPAELSRRLIDEFASKPRSPGALP